MGIENLLIETAKHWAILCGVSVAGLGIYQFQMQIKANKIYDEMGRAGITDGIELVDRVVEHQSALSFYNPFSNDERTEAPFYIELAKLCIKLLASPVTLSHALLTNFFNRNRLNSIRFYLLPDNNHNAIVQLEFVYDGGVETNSYAIPKDRVMGQYQAINFLKMRGVPLLVMQ